MDLALVLSVLAALLPSLVYGVSVGNPSDLTAWEILRDGAGTWMPLDTTALPVAESPVDDKRSLRSRSDPRLSITFTANSALSGTYPVDQRRNRTRLRLHLSSQSIQSSGQVDDNLLARHQRQSAFRIIQRHRISSLRIALSLIMSRLSILLGVLWYLAIR